MGLTVFIGLGAALPADAANAASGTKSSSYEHVWVHYDYMVGPSHNFSPSREALRMVVDVFHAHGVILHIDPDANAVPEHATVLFDVEGVGKDLSDDSCLGPDAVRFSAVKAENFSPDLNHSWHYVLFANRLDTYTDGDPQTCKGYGASAGMSGFGEIPGDDLVVTLGALGDPDSTDGGCFLDYATGDFSLPCWPVPDYMVAAAFMHELGHNLGLRHGGDTDANNKPNYVSVMNYAYQIAGGIPTAPPAGSSDFLGLRLDYSDEALPTLDEGNLNESAGLGSTAHPGDIAFWYVPGPAQLTGSAAGPVDWNGDGDASDAGLSIDLNNDGAVSGAMRGFDDWAFIHAQLRKGDGGD